MKYTKPNFIWHKAKLTPLSKGVFADSFYPENGEVYTTKVDITPNVSKIIVATKLSESGIRILTPALADVCLSVVKRVESELESSLNNLVLKLKV